MTTQRIVSWFSCGAASAVATKLALAENAGRLPFEIVYTEVFEEHEDNKRFLKECEAWFAHPITILRNEKYNASIYEVFRKDRYLVGPSGARCTKVLKKGERLKFERSGDRQVFGYTSEEQDRVDRFIDSNNNVDLWVPLVDRDLRKADCLAILKRAGIELPAMYKLGYRNNNCIGCVKGGAGYWNKIRVDFPLVFERMSDMEQYLGRTVTKETINGESQRVYLKDLSLDAGRYEAEPDIECGIFCLMASEDAEQTYSKVSESDSKNQIGLLDESSNPMISLRKLAERTGLEPATPGVTGPVSE